MQRTELATSGIKTDLLAEKRMAESWSPKQNSMMCLVPPDPDFVALKRRLKHSRDNIRRSRSDFFSSPSPATRTPTPNDILWEHRPVTYQQGDRLSVPSICVTNNSGSPMSLSDVCDELDGASTSSQSLRYFSEDDEGVELRRPSSGNLFSSPGPVTRSQSFQERIGGGSGCSLASDDPLRNTAGRFVVKRVVSEDEIIPGAKNNNNRLHRKAMSATADVETLKPHMVSRLLAKMRRITLDWRRANKSRRGELPPSQNHVLGFLPTTHLTELIESHPGNQLTLVGGIGNWIRSLGSWFALHC